MRDHQRTACEIKNLNNKINRIPAMRDYEFRLDAVADGGRAANQSA